MRCRTFRFTGDLLAQMFSEGNIASDFGVQLSVERGIPEDTRILDVRMDHATSIIDFLCEHESFPELPDGVYMWGWDGNSDITMSTKTLGTIRGEELAQEWEETHGEAALDHLEKMTRLHD